MAMADTEMRLVHAALPRSRGGSSSSGNIPSFSNAALSAETGATFTTFSAAARSGRPPLVDSIVVVDARNLVLG